ncbi:MAG: HAD-IC family P-type ATPase, partial [Promethearchaeota archaeon]
MFSLEDTENGLDTTQILKRLNRYGYNEIISKKPNLVLQFLRKFLGFTPLMLFITILLEIVIGKYYEAYLIIALLIFNSSMSFFQERKANLALELLKKKLQVKVKVKRQGEWLLIPAREIVPDDIVRLKSGDFVPADVLVLSGKIEVDQSSITGESYLIEKQYNHIIYAGSIVRRGEVIGKTKATANQTFFGRTVKLIELAKPKFHSQIMISKVVRWLILIVIFSIILAILLSFIRKLDLLTLTPLFVVLLVASIPIALPTMFTISMALGSSELSKKGVLITRLDAVEDVALMDIICIDKTGTLTLNKLRLSKLICNSRFKENDIILYGALASQEADADPIDFAFIEAIKEKNLPYNDYNQKKILPFDPINRRTEAIIERNGYVFIVLKGAVNTIFKMCDLSHILNFEDIQNKIKILYASGYRLIAVAYGRNKNNLELVGIAALYDQIRSDVSNLIQRVNKLGISLKMLTGDALSIAKEVGKNLGIGENIISHTELTDLLKNDYYRKNLEDIEGFAEIFPEDKYLIVKNLQKFDHVLGMTGDGVNDAPALKQSEVGIAVKNSTDVAKKASSVVLTEETLEGIINLIE